MSGNEKVLVVANPASGNGRGAALLEALRAGTDSARRIAAACAAGDPAAWPVIQTSQDGGWRREVEARLGADSCRTVMAIGGDGTLMETASLLHRAGRGGGGREPFSVIPVPAGRGNDFVRGLCGYDTRMGDFWTWAVGRGNWAREPLDLAEANGRVFVNMASLGYGGRIVESAHRRNAFWSKTSVVYQVEGALAMLEKTECRCEATADGRLAYQGPFFGAFIGNGKANGSGLYWTRNASFGDGRIDGVVFPRPGVLEMARTIRAVKDRRAPVFTHRELQGAEIRLEFDQPIALELDGDFIGNATSYGFKCLPAALCVWVLKN